MKKLKEELTEKMHSEFSVDAETEIKHKAGSMWATAGFACNDATLRKWCKSYGITTQQAIKYKEYWKKLSK